MKSFKKVLISMVSFLLITFIFTTIIYEPFVNSEIYYFCDTKYRKSLSGTLDTLIIGASNSIRAYNPNIIDEITNTNTYNLSGSLINWPGRLALLEEEIDRNDLETVFIDVTLDSLQRDPDTLYSSEGNIYVLPRLDSLYKRTKFFFENVNLDTFEKFYSTMLYDGFRYYVHLAKKILLGTQIPSSVDYNKKGYITYGDDQYKNLTLDKKQAVELHNTEEIDLNFNKTNCDILSKMIELCQKKNISVVIITTPYSNSSLWKYSNYNDFHDQIEKIAEDNDCEYWDFNLSKNLNISDENGWHDWQHITNKTIPEVSKEFANVYYSYLQGKDTNGFFFDKLEEKEKTLVYYQYISE